MSQNSQVLRYMQEKGSITSWDAFKHLKCTRLSGRIKDLRDMGYPVVTTMAETRDRKNKVVSRYAVYSLKTS